MKNDYAKRKRILRSTGVALALAIGMSHPAVADQPFESAHMAKITGEEEFVYVWTLGVEGVGDGSDKIVTVDVRKDSLNFGRVIDIDSVDGHHEARHGGFIDDGRQYWAPGLGWQSNMVSGNAVGKRLYYTSSLLADGDKGGDDNQQFLKVYEWDGKEMTKRFEIDFLKERLGRPHLINFGSTSLYGN